MSLSGVSTHTDGQGVGQGLGEGGESEAGTPLGGPWLPDVEQAGAGAKVREGNVPATTPDVLLGRLGHWSLSLGGLFVGGLEVIDTGAPAGTQPGDSSEVVGSFVPAGAPLSVLSS